LRFSSTSTGDIGGVWGRYRLVSSIDPESFGERVNVLASFNEATHFVGIVFTLPQILLNAFLVIEVIGEGAVNVAKSKSGKVLPLVNCHSPLVLGQLHIEGIDFLNANVTEE
jgi:hypothetical protein